MLARFARSRRVDEVDIGRRIREERERISVSQADLARAVSMDDHKLNKIESGVHKLHALELMRIARALDVDPFDIFYPRPSFSFRGDDQAEGVDAALSIFEHFVRDCMAVDHLTAKTARPT